MYRKRKYTKKSSNVRKIVKKELRNSAEKKVYLQSTIPVNISYTGNMFDLFLPAQGLTSQNRVGDSCQYDRLIMRLNICGASTADSTNIVRAIIFKWHPDSAIEAPTPSDILQNTYLASALAPLAPYSPAVNAASKKFSIIYDKTVTTQSNGTRCYAFTINKSLKGNCLFNAAGVTHMHGMYMLLISDDGLSAWPSASFVCETKFFDL